MDAVIPFNRPYIAGKEMYYIAKAVLGGRSSGDGPFTKKCHAFIEKILSTPKALLTQSYGSALDMAAMLCDLSHGDEVIMPSFAFVSVANSFYMRGAVPVFVDIRPDTLNLDETLITGAITSRTKVIVTPHYAGVGCEMDIILDIARKNNLLVVEDAANGFFAKYRDKYLGTMADLGVLSFHETNSIMCGEGGALLINNENFYERAEIIREKGTNRSKFFRGEVDKYTWVALGSSFLPSDLVAAFLYAQFENMNQINERRSNIFDYYYNALIPLAKEGLLKLPNVSGKPDSNHHLFYILLKDEQTRDGLMDYLKSNGILAVFHYLPLHLSAIGRSMGYADGQLPVTESMSGRLLRLPFYYELQETDQQCIVDCIMKYFEK